MRRVETDSKVLYTFDSFEEYLDRASNPVWKKPLKNKPNTPWYDREQYHSGWPGPTFQEALKHARLGHAESIPKIEQWANLAVDEITSQIPKPELEFDKTGTFWDLGRYIEGDPECWYNEVPSQDIEREGKGNIIRVVINTACNATALSAFHTRRCGVVVAVASLLESIGFYLQVEITTSLSTGWGRKDLEFRTVAKRPGEAMNIAALSFWSSRDMERHIDFAICETMPEIDGYGGAAFTSDPGDICFDRGSQMDTNWYSDEDAKKYIKEILRRQGVKFLGEV